MACEYCGRRGCDNSCEKEEELEEIMDSAVEQVIQDGRLELRAVALEISEKGFYSLNDYVRFCTQNKILVF